jgi:hypothetical protein
MPHPSIPSGLARSHDELANLRARRTAIEDKIADLERGRAGIDCEIERVSQSLTRMALPCWTCDRPQAPDAQHLARVQF